MRFRILAVVLTSSFAAAQPPSSAGGSPEHHSDMEITWHILKPLGLPAPDVSQWHVPAGFRYRVGADGLAAGPPVRVASRSGLHGIAFSKGKVYLAAVHEIFKADVLPDGTFGPLEMMIHDLPDAGQHNTRTVQIGPDDMMDRSSKQWSTPMSRPQDRKRSEREYQSFEDQGFYERH